jgi:hypothetical protein
MSLAFNKNGFPVNIGDRCSIIGVIQAVSPSVSGSNSNVTVLPPLTASTFICSVQDINTPEGTSCGPASGNQVTVGNDCTVSGLVTAITSNTNTGIVGTNTALLTVQLFRSGLSITVPSGACNSDNV